MLGSLGRDTDANTKIDRQIAEVRAQISSALASFRRRSADLQQQIELWSRKSEARRRGSNRALERISCACDFATKCVAAAEQLRSPVFICRNIEAVLAAHSLRPDDATIVLDLIEAPFYRVRWNCLDRPIDPFVHALDRAVAGLLSLTDVAMAASAGLSEELQRAGVRAILLPNYPLPRPFAEAPGVREACELEPTDRLALLFEPGDKGFFDEPILGALAHLPDSYHLAIIEQRFDDCAARYRRELRDQIAETDLTRRVHLLPPVAPEQLPMYAGGADVGVIGLDPAHSGDRLLLPASVFDCVAARLPVAAGDLPEIHEALKPYGVSSKFDRRSPQSIAASIASLAQAKPGLRPALDKAAHELVWGRNEPGLLGLLPETDAVTLLRAGPPADECRTNRIASTLLEHGIEVTIARSARASDIDAPPKSGLARARFVDFAIDA